MEPGKIDINTSDFNFRSPVENKTALVILAGTLCVTMLLSLCIPLCTRSTKDTIVSVSHPRLFPLYYQTNSDSPTELRSSLGFPQFFRQCQLRTDRPLVLGLAAGVRAAAVPVLKAVMPQKLFTVKWGDFRVVEIMVTYFAWILFNFLFTGVAGFLCFKAFSPVFGSAVGLLAALFMVTSPITILSMREISEGSVQILIASASLFFWQRVMMEKEGSRRIFALSLGMGVLFLGKLAATTFTAGAVLCLLSKKRKILGLIVPVVFLPMLCWIGILFFLGIPFSIDEIHANKAALSGIASHPVLPRLLAFAPSWMGALGENGLFVQLPFAVLGFYTLFKKKFPLLWVFPLFAGLDFCFFFWLDRAHAVYGIHTMILYFPAVAVGVINASRWILARINHPLIKNKEALVVAGMVLIIQFLLIAGTVPTYGG